MNYDPLPQIPLVESAFPNEIVLPTEALNRRVIYYPDNTASSCKKFVDVMRHSIGRHYIKHKGPEWEHEKLNEMQEDCLIYVYYCDSTSNVIAFVSFVLTFEEGLVLYLYEIQILPDYQGQGLGKTLIDSFHQLAPMYREGLVIDGLDISDLEGTKLTVFSDNKALNWYQMLGYELAEESPTDKKLRGGKVIKPDYYILFRKV